MSTINFTNVNKIYPNGVQAVFDFNLKVKDKEFIVLVGPSGCGKSTTLRMLAGLEDISTGTISINNRVINMVHPKDRDMAMVFQSYALYPHMTVYDNMAFSLKLRPKATPALDENGCYIKVVDEQEIRNCRLLLDTINVKKEQSDIKKYEKRIEYLKNNPTAVKGKNKKLPEEEKKKIVLDEITRLEGTIRSLKNSDSETKIKELKERIESLKANPSAIQMNYHSYTKEEINKRVMEAAEVLGLVPFLKRKPAALSGGQRQRVALGRAIVRDPKVFLMDEPLSNLDAKLRVQMRSQIIKIHERVGAITVYVTHDQTEAMTMASRIVVMKDGYIQQIGTPKEVYNDPANIFVGGFIGAPAMNFLKGTYSKGTFYVDQNDKDDPIVKFNLSDEHKKILKNYEDKHLVLGVRPEDIFLKTSPNIKNESNFVDCQCDLSELLGAELIIYSYINQQRIIFKTDAYQDVKKDDKIKICLNLDRVYFFDEKTTLRIGGKK